jgi:hypothetical protein
MDAPLETRNLELEASGPVFSRALFSAMARVPIWLIIWLVLLVLSLAVALPWHSWFGQTVGQRYEVGTISANLDEVFRFDHRAALSSMNSATAQVGAILAFVAMLLGVFFAGGWLQVLLERTRGQSLRRFLFGGARYFWRFLRLLVCSLAMLALFGWLIYGTPLQSWILGSWLGVPKSDWATLESLDSEGTVFAVRAAQDALFGLCFALTLCWGDYTRTRLALQDTYSALWAGLSTFFTMLRHPIKTLGPLFMLLLIEILVIVSLGTIVNWVEQGFTTVEGVEPAGTMRVWVVFGLSQAILMWRCVIRGARYHATAIVSQEIVRPLSRPDPWRESIGGPGGPRYPLEEGDEYGVAL